MPRSTFCGPLSIDRVVSEFRKRCSDDYAELAQGIDDAALADGDATAIRLEDESPLEDGRTVDGDADDARAAGSGPDDARATLEALRGRLERDDPDVLVVSHAELVPLLSRRAAEVGLESFALGRLPGWTRLAGSNTDESYGRVGHSPARYRVPGRAIVDTSNSFLWQQSGLVGLEYMVEQTGRPLQEAAWGSIGTLLTSRQIRLARREWDVLAPQNKWEPERFSDVRTLHSADRGGFTFAPDVGFHERVHEIDFSSLYPRIICEYGISPETVGCAHESGDTAPSTRRVPDLEYELCDGGPVETPFLPSVLEPLLADEPPESTARRLRAESGAIKWVLVSCFGYRGYRNAKYGRIECHEAINAYARDIALTAKRRLEDADWRIVHGIVDSLWVTPREGVDPEPLESVIADVPAAVGIPLEHDGSYEWVCFVPLRESIRGRETATDQGGAAGDAETPHSSGTAGALTKYFGKRESGSYTFRGIELRQRSTPAFVVESQRAFVEALDRDRDPIAVCDVLSRRLGMLRRGDVDPSDLEITKRVSKPRSAYRQRTRTVGALEQYDRHGIERRPGQSVRYVVVDDDARTADRVRIPVEPIDKYDLEFYEGKLVEACESVLSPFGWDRTRIRRHVSGVAVTRLAAFVD